MEAVPPLVRRTAIALFVVVAIGLFVAAGFMLIRRLTRQAVTNITTPIEQPLDLGSVVTQVRELARLETAAMRVMHVGTIKQEYRLVPDALGGDEITFLATGDVVAGIDLSELKPEDVWREGDFVVMRLPRPQILISRVDNEKSRVLHRKTGLARRADPHLETRARQFAETNIRNKARQEGILPMAEKNAEAKLADLLHKLGAKRVRFVRGGARRAEEQR